MPNHRKTTPQFVEEAQRVHGEKFDNSEVEYVNTHTPVKIKCRQCGVVFMQEPASHLVGYCCPKWCPRGQILFDYDGCIIQITVLTTKGAQTDYTLNKWGSQYLAANLFFRAGRRGF